MAAGELALAFLSGGLGWAIADGIDRYLATYNPSATTTPPTNLFTGGTNGTQANTLNIASPPGLLRIGVGIGVTAVPGILASLVRNPMGKAALQGMMLGSGIKLFGNLWNSYVMAKMLAPANSQQATMQGSLGARLYPAEVVAQQNLALSPVPYSAPTGLNQAPGQQAAPRQLPAGGVGRGGFGVGQGGDVGPYATTVAPPAAPAAPTVAACPQGSVVVTASSVPPGVSPVNLIWQDSSGNQHVQTPQQPGPPSSTLIAYCVMPGSGTTFPTQPGSIPGPMNPPVPAPSGPYAPPPQGGTTPPSNQDDCGCGLSGSPEYFAMMSAAAQ